VRRGAFLLFFLAVSFLWLGTLGLRPLYKADESRYAEIPREMVASGDWLTPRLNGFKYFEKPPLQYWATAAAFSIFGEQDWAARLWTALAALGGIALAFLSGKRLFSREAGALAAFVLAGCPLYVILAQVNTLDMALSFFLCAAIFAFALGRYHLFWAACALAVLSKGLIGIVLPLGTVGLYVLFKRDFSILAKMKILSGGALFLLICAPWFVAVSAANPEFAHFFFIQEHLQRFTTRMHGRYQPAWYFLPVLAFGIAPWLLLAFSPFKALVSRERAGGAFDPALFLALWVAVVFVFFSASSSKLPSYILPMFPALAVLIGQRIATQRPRRLLALQAALAALAGIAMALLAFRVENFMPKASADLAKAYVPYLVIAGTFLALAALGAAEAAWRGRLELGVALLACASLGCTLTALVGHRALAPAFSIASQAAALPALPPQAPIFAVDFYDHTLPWYFGRTVTMVRYKDELGEAIKWEPHKFIAELAGFAQAWREAPAAYAVLSSENYEALARETGLPMQVVSRGPRYTIVRKP
jgi:4-amino-4-deoxy-L-arabinose transferase-like glycosyltransferase